MTNQESLTAENYSKLWGIFRFDSDDDGLASGSTSPSGLTSPARLATSVTHDEIDEDDELPIPEKDEFTQFVEKYLDLDPDPEIPWQVDAVCSETDPDMFFPEKGGSTREARAICHQCPVKAQCLVQALETDVRFGIWGATSERQRREIRRIAKYENLSYRTIVEGFI